MANHRIAIPFPVWDFLYEKQEEIARLLNEKFDVKWAPNKTPRSIEFKKVKPGEHECDRLKIKLWYPGGVYVTAVIGGWESSWGTGWSLVGYKTSWTYHDAFDNWKKFSCSIEADEEAAMALETAAHCYMELISTGNIYESDVNESIENFKSFNAFKKIEVK